MDTDESLYHAVPQTRGKLAHEGVDKKTYSHRKEEILSLPVCSDELGIMGKIDLYKQKEKLLIERKYQLAQIYQGQIYQLWAQCFCLQEMGYVVEQLAFYEISTNKMFPIAMPTESDRMQLANFITEFKSYDPSRNFFPNPNKCKHCIYSSLCDKTIIENVYS